MTIKSVVRSVSRTSNKTSTDIQLAVDALSGDVESINLKIGDLSQLPTQAKENLVAAFNEIINALSGFADHVYENYSPTDDDAGLGGTDVTWSADKSSRELAALAETIDSLNSRIDTLNTRIDDLSVGEEEVVYFDEVVNNILTSGSLSIEALPNYIISPIGEDIPVFPPAIQSDSATEGKWYATLYGNEYDVTDMGFSLGDNGELLLTYEIVSVSFGFPFTYRVTDANSNMVQTQIYVYGELDTGDLDQIKLVDGPNILAAFTSTLEPTELDFTFTNTPTMYLNENIVSLPESAPVYKHPRGYTVGNAIAQVEPTIGLARVTGADYAGPIGYYNNYYKFALISDKVLEDNGYFLHIVCEGLVLVSKPIQYFNSRSNPDGESFPQLADQYVTDFCTHTVDFDDNYATVDQFTGDPNFIPIDDFNQQDTLESSVLFPYIDKKISFVLTTTENLIL
jgi:outer membrane murein-binding lipoprotein Lpp